MKVLQINNVYAEKSTGKITRELHQGLLQAGIESVVVYGRGVGAREKGVIRLCPEWYGKANSLLSRITGLPYGGCLLSTARLKRIIRREKPDVVHLQCVNEHFVNIYRLVEWLKKHRIKTVCSLHAEFMYTANCGYAFDCDQWHHGCTRCPNKRKSTKSWFFDRTGSSWRRMKRAFEGFEKDCVICPVSPWTEERGKQSDILRNFSFRTVYNGVNTDEIFYWDRETVKSEKTVLNVTSFFSDEPGQIKGGAYLIELARRMPDVIFQVAGKAPQIAGLPENLVLLGEVCDQRELAEYYRKARLFVMVSKKETFSMPCAESLCCGTPVVGFRAGAPEQISLPAFSGFVDQGDLSGLGQTLRQWLAREDLDPANIADAAREAYSVQTMVRRFVEIYRSMLWN